MPEHPDYATLIRGQIAVLDRIHSGEAGLPVLTQLVRLAQDVLGGRGAGFAEYTRDHGRVVAATGDCARALGRRVDREDGHRAGRRTLLIPLKSLNGEFASHIEGGDVQRMLGARCEADGATVGSLHVYFHDGQEPGPEHHSVLELHAPAGDQPPPREVPRSTRLVKESYLYSSRAAVPVSEARVRRLSWS